MLPDYTDALERALGIVIRDAEKSLEGIKSQCDAVLAATAARVAEAEARLVALDARIAEKLAALPAPKDGKDGIDGKSVTVEDLLPALRDEVAIRIAEIPVPRDGKDGSDGMSVTVDDLEPVIAQQVSKAVAAIPVPKDGKDGSDGASVTLDDVAPLIAEAVGRAVAEIPQPKDGKDGKDGVDGKLPVVSSWGERVYYRGEVCAFEGATYQAVRDTGRAPPHDDWQCLAARGEDAREIELRGTYDDKTAYRRLDVVALNGASFIAKRDAPGACPGDGWQLFARQGKQGKPGDPGREGKTGERGPAGPPLASGEIDEQGMLTLHNADGSSVEIDLYPLLSKL